MRHEHCTQPAAFYIGNTWDHYCCREIYINNTKHSRTCNTVFFKHKYLTMPTITPADGLILAADNMTAAIAGVVPPPNMTVDAIDQLMNIFKLQAEKEKNDATIQRVLKDCAQAERVRMEEGTKAPPRANPTTMPITEGNNLTITPPTTKTPTPAPIAKLSAAPSDKPTISFPRFEAEYPDVDLGI
jgi:hypothetical protein